MVKKRNSCPDSWKSEHFLYFLLSKIVAFKYPNSVVKSAIVLRSPSNLLTIRSFYKTRRKLLTQGFRTDVSWILTRFTGYPWTSTKPDTITYTRIPFPRNELTRLMLKILVIVKGHRMWPSVSCVKLSRNFN